MKTLWRFLPFFLFASILPLSAQSVFTGANPLPLDSLPEAPRATAAFLPVSSSTPVQSQQVSSPASPEQAPRLARLIEPNQRAVPLSAADKMKMALWGQVTPYAFGTQILAAGWEHLLDSNPKYGSDSAGFGERLGAAALRQTSQAIFSNGAAVVFRQDPRYYRKGSGSIINRGLYSASRVLVTRTDAGAEAVNYSELVGYAGASALTMTYYPAVSATWGNTASGYVLSLAASALGNEAHEFLPDLVRILHLRRK